MEKLVGCTLDHALREVFEETELGLLRLHQASFAEAKSAEISRVHALEAEQIAREEEKRRRIVQAKARLEREKIVLRKIECVQISKRAISGIFENVLTKMRNDGKFKSLRLVELEGLIVPQLVKDALLDGGISEALFRIFESAYINVLCINVCTVCTQMCKLYT